jgi:hypothetical protein
MTGEDGRVRGELRHDGRRLSHYIEMRDEHLAQSNLPLPHP